MKHTAFILLCFLSSLSIHAQNKSQPSADVINSVDKMFFIENKGQWNGDVLYLCRMGNLDAWITKYGVNYDFYKYEEIPSNNKDEIMLPSKFQDKEYNIIGHRVLLNLHNHNTSPMTEGKDKQEAYYNYLIGNDFSKHASYVGLYKEAIVKNVYNGIDIRYYFDRGSLRYDYIVHPGADPSQIVFTLEGSDQTFLDDKGNLVFTTRFGEVSIAELKTYQGKNKSVVESHFIQKEGNWSFSIEDYDRTQDLIIDPVIYSTYIGGSNLDIGYDITLDITGNVYITGFSYSNNYATTSGAYQTTGGIDGDVIVTKLNTNGSSLVYSTYIGGNYGDTGYSIDVDSAGNAFIVGSSPLFPTTPGAFKTFHGNFYVTGFVCKLNSSGTAFIYSTYIGGSAAPESVYGIAIDNVGNAYIVGYTGSFNFPTTAGAYQNTILGHDAFVIKLNATGSSLLYSTLLGGISFDAARKIAIDNIGNAYVTGYTQSPDFDVTIGAYQSTSGGDYDVFITKLNPTGSALLYSTYLGGNNTEYVSGIKIDATGNAYVTGRTNSTNFDVTPGAFQMTNDGGYDAFVSKLNNTGTSLVYSTYIGGSGTEYGEDIVIDNNGNAIITGLSTSSNYDILNPGTVHSTNQGNSDVIVTKLNSTGSGLLYSTYLGGMSSDYGYGLASDSAGYIYVVGDTKSNNFLITPGAFQQSLNGTYEDVFITKLCLISSPLTSGFGTDNQSICLGAPIANIAYNFYGASSASISGLPAGVTSSISGNSISISGTPTNTGVHTYTITLSGGCSNYSATGKIEVTTNTAISLSSTANTNNQSVCQDSSITNILYSLSASTGATVSGLPAGITSNFIGNTLTISGKPSTSGTYIYTVTPTSTCGSPVSATGTINVIPKNTISLTSAIGTDSQAVCVNTPITAIVYTCTGATGATVSGLPTGVTSTFLGNTLTISGTTSLLGTHNYTITLTGGCGIVTKTGKIKTFNNTISISPSGSTHQSVCINTPINSVFCSTIGATSGTVTNLPPGVIGSFNNDTLTISGTPTVVGVYNYTITMTGTCNSVTYIGSFTVQPISTLSFASAIGTDSQSVCIGTQITPIVYNKPALTYMTVNGLPPGIITQFNNVNNTITIFGSSNTPGTYTYTVSVTNPCGTPPLPLTGTIVIKKNTITLSSGTGTNNQVVCKNTPITNITYATTHATGANFSGLPPGVTGSFASNTITISGTPTTVGTYTYTVLLTGGCGANVSSTGTINVTGISTINLISGVSTDNQTICFNDLISTIEYSITSASGVTITGLPSGVTYTFTNNLATISGTPNVTGTYIYTVTSTGLCGSTSTIGTISITPSNIISLTSATGSDNQDVCIDNSITNITYNMVGVTGVTVFDLPPGVTYSFSNNTVIITGTPTVAGSYNYIIMPSGGCGNSPISGTIVVTPNNTIILTSASGTTNQTLNINVPIANIIYSTTGATNATVSGLPPGVTASFANNKITISGTPTASGFYDYIVTLTGGCGNATATGRIKINAPFDLEDVQVNSSWMIYPNPNKGIFIIQSESSGSFELLDINGKILNTFQVHNTKEPLVLNHLAAGTYFLREKSTGITKKFIIE